MAATEAGVKPIFGLEAYCATGKNRRKWHLTILASSALGYQNLMRLVSRSWAEGFYQFPTVSGDMLKECSEGLIVLSGCADSQLSCALLGGKGVEPHPADLAGAEKVAHAFKALLGDRYYLETQMFPGLERTRTLNPAWEELGRRVGISLVATADVHYPFPGDNELQRVLHSAGRGLGSVDKADSGWEYDILLTYPESDLDVRGKLVQTGLSARAAEQALASTAEIAERCTVVLPKAERLVYPGIVRDTIGDW